MAIRIDSLVGYLYVAEENYKNSISEIYNLNSTVNNQYTAGYIVDTSVKFGVPIQTLLKQKI